MGNTWIPEYARWRHGGWYVTNVHYPSGACGCVSRNYSDGKWRIANEEAYPGSPRDRTFLTRDDAARAERELVAGTPMNKPTGYIVRPKDMKALVRQLNRPQASLGELYDAARTLIGWAEPQQTQLPPVSVASLALPPEADALDRIADAYLADLTVEEALSEIGRILFETGRAR